MNSTLKSNATYSVIENAKNFAHITAYKVYRKIERAPSDAFYFKRNKTNN